MEDGVRHEGGEDRGRFVLFRDGAPVGELTWFRTGPGQVVADHTFVEPAYRGRSLGNVLFDALVAWARAHGERVTPTCWFVADLFRLRPDTTDVRA